MYTVRLSVGRFIEISIASPFESSDLKPFQTLVIDAIQASQSKVIVCADIRRAAVFTQDVVLGFINLLRGDNPKIERTGILIAGSAVFAMQIERIVRGANNRDRRTFRNTVDCVAWLSERLSSDERKQLQRFVWV